MTSFWGLHTSVAYKPIVFHVWAPILVWIIWNWHVSELAGAFRLPVERCETDRPTAGTLRSCRTNRKKLGRLLSQWWASAYRFAWCLAPLSSCKHLLNSSPCLEPSYIIRAARCYSGLNASGQHRSQGNPRDREHLGDSASIWSLRFFHKHLQNKF